MKNLVRTGLAGLSLTLAAVAFAQAPAPAASNLADSSASPAFGSLDLNKDGKVSQSEVQSHSELKSAFASLDADRDSYLSQSEFSKWKSGSASGVLPADPGRSPPQSDAPRADTEAGK